MWIFRLERLQDMSAADIGALVRVPAAGPKVLSAMRSIPRLDVDYQIQPITRGILRVTCGAMSVALASRDHFVR
jgi:hypothetical protein